MITKANYFSKVDSIDYNSLPEALKEGFDTIKFGSKEYTTWEYLEDDEEFLNVYFEKLNSFINKEKVVEKKAEKVVKKISKTAKSKPASKGSAARKKSASGKQKGKKKKSATPKTPVEAVEKVQEEVRFIKRYVFLHGKEKTKPQILTFINSLQKAITEKRIRKTSAYANEIVHIQEQLVKLFNAMGEVAKVEINDKTLEKYTAIAGGEKTMMSILFIKRYISLHGKTNVKEKAERLFKQMKHAAEKQKVLATDPYKEKMEIIYNSLNDYITGETNSPTIQKAELNGLLGIAGIKLFSKKKA